MSSDRFLRYPGSVAYLTEELIEAATWVWMEFYRTLATSGHECDCAIWTTPYDPACIAVYPANGNSTEIASPMFCYSAAIVGFDEIQDELMAVSEAHFLEHVKPFYNAFNEWTRNSIVAAWCKPSVQEGHGKLQLPRGKFGIYATSIQDFGLDEITDQYWIAGDHLFTT